MALLLFSFCLQCLPVVLYDFFFFFHFSNESVLVAIGTEISTHSLLHGRNIIFRRKASSANCLSQDPNLTQEWLFLICQWTRTFALIDM